ncbi:MAG: DUF1934 family protein [Solobacterium sp.]|nr:DUF1934 family protein [Solobacterium sp.]
MIVAVTAIREDLLDGTKERIADQSRGILTKDSLTFRETAPYEGKDTISFQNQEFHLHHIGETESILELKPNQEGSAEVRSPYGTMRMKAMLIHGNWAANEVLIEYRILEEAECVSHIRFLIQITDLS